MSNALRLAVTALCAIWVTSACQAVKPAAETLCSELAQKNLPSGTIAAVDGQPITDADLAKALKGRAKGTFMKAQSEYFDAKKEALDDYLYNRLVDEAAKKAGKTSAQLIEEEVTRKVKKVTERDIQAFYDKIKDQRKGFGGQMPELTKVSGQIRQKLEQDAASERKAAFFADLQRKHKVAYLMEAPRITVETGSQPPRGNPNAPVTIVEFSDFECPFCKRGAQTVEEVLKTYKGKVRLYFRDFPLAFHSKAKPAAVAARCAGEQGKFWEYHDKLFAKQELDPEKLAAHAKELKLDVAKFETCVKDGKQAAEVDKDMEAASELGVSGTPAFFINGKMLSGALPPEAFKEIIDKELARSKG